MMNRNKKFELKRTVQCAKCPWKVSTNPREIPHGYCETKHRDLAKTIADSDTPMFGQSINVMACHHSTPDNMEHCIGWLHNQLGRGHNIPLRVHMLNCSNIAQMRIVGDQHERFEDTLPK